MSVAAKSILNELDKLLEDSTFAIKTANGSFSPLTDEDLCEKFYQQAAINQVGENVVCQWRQCCFTISHWNYLQYTETSFWLGGNFFSRSSGTSNDRLCSPYGEHIHYGKARLHDAGNEFSICHIFVMETGVYNTSLKWRLLVHLFQERIVTSLNLTSSSGEMESYCLMWSLHPYINDEIMQQAWRLIH